MSTSSRLTEALNAAPEIPFDDESRLILFSDCHRGDNSWADDSARNQTLMFYALQHYLREGFTYIEIGDGDELWENASFETILQAHSHLYWLLSQFYQQNRLIMLFGNHNMVWKYPENVKRELSTYYDEVTRQEQPLFKGITVHEALILKHRETQKRLFVIHGHQGDLMAETLWRLSRFFVRVLWKPLQILGVRDPTSPAYNFLKRNAVERKLIAWVQEQAQPMICGHTHRSVLPNSGEAPYYNTGSGVHPRCITGIEIADGALALIKWSISPDEEGAMHVVRDVLEGPRKIAAI